MSRICQILGVKPMSGNNVSHSNRKTKRRFLPNLREMKFFSNALGVDVKLRVASSTLRTINKNGGIDSFLVNARFAKLTIEAQKLRNKIKKKLIAIDKISEVKNIKEKKPFKKVSARKAKKAQSK